MNCLLTVLSNIGGSGSEEHFLGKIVKEKLDLKFVYFKIPGRGYLSCIYYLSNISRNLLTEAVARRCPIKKVFLKRISQN